MANLEDEVTLGTVNKVENASTYTYGPVTHPHTGESVLTTERHYTPAGIPC